MKSVTNKIDVLPVSGFDDDLRFRIARAIYNNANFWGYGSMVNPPIHVIVEHGRVTLEGVVNNNTDAAITVTPELAVEGSGLQVIAAPAEKTLRVDAHSEARAVGGEEYERRVLGFFERHLDGVAPV